MSNPIKPKRVSVSGPSKKASKKVPKKKVTDDEKRASWNDFQNALDQIPDDVTDLSQISDEMKAMIERQMNKIKI
ncbi:MAG: hypothetical protein PHG66_06240 [Candidatus Colwellbacteria bacterium]|nr:hypothetical protein [Candidatus Colwellbacteria bacterium]